MKTRVLAAVVLAVVVLAAVVSSGVVPFESAQAAKVRTVHSKRKKVISFFILVFSR